MSYPASMAPGDTAEGKLKFLFNPNMPAYCRDGEPDEPNTFNLRITEETAKATMLSEASELLGL